MELTDEQWEHLINWYRLTRGEESAQALIAARRFQTSMNEIQSLAGHSQEQLGEINQAILDMAR
jgi:hypothetical protein